MIVIAADDEVITQQNDPSLSPKALPPDGEIVLEDDDGPLESKVPASKESIEPVGQLPEQDFEPYDANVNYERLVPQEDTYENENKTLDIPEKVWLSTNKNVPLRIVYTTLRGQTTERTVFPDHVHYAKGHAILVAWCQLRNDWRAFIVDRISQAKLEG